MIKEVVAAGLLGIGSGQMLRTDAEPVQPAVDAARVSAPTNLHALGKADLTLVAYFPPAEIPRLREQLTPLLAAANLQLVAVPEPAQSVQYSDSVVITPAAEDCAAEFVISEDDDSLRSVSPGIFGRVRDMTDLDKINGDEMFNGTFGHGDEALASARGDAAYLQVDLTHPSAIQKLAQYLTDSTTTLCEIFDVHKNDPDGGFPG